MKSVFISVFLYLILSNQPKVVFNVPELSRKTITQIRKILGKPKYDVLPTDYQAQAGATGDAFFNKEGYTLEVTYNPTNKKVNDFFISEEHSVADYKHLLALSNVLNNPNFIITPVHENKHPTLFTGVTITPR